jgi:hypothetical protein
MLLVRLINQVEKGTGVRFWFNLIYFHDATELRGNNNMYIIY